MGNRSGYMNSKELAVEAAKEAIKLFKKEEKEKNKRNRLHNTGLLMSKYIELQEHYETIKYRATEIEEDLEPVDFKAITQDDIIIDSIKRSKIRTMIILSQINSAVKLLEASMKQKNESEKCEVLRRLYMDPSKKDLKFNAKVKEVAENMTAAGIPCSESTVRRWSNEMLNELSVKLFGVDGLRMDI